MDRSFRADALAALQQAKDSWIWESQRQHLNLALVYALLDLGDQLELLRPDHPGPRAPLQKATGDR